MSHDLRLLAPATRRLVLVCYAQQHPASMRQVSACLRDQTWAPTPDECPVPWQDVQRWYRGLQRTGQMVMDSY